MNQTSTISKLKAGVYSCHRSDLQVVVYDEPKMLSSGELSYGQTTQEGEEITNSQFRVIAVASDLK